MAEYHARSPPARLRGLEPRNQQLRLRFLRRSLGAQHQAPIRVDVAQTCEAVRDESQTLVTFESIVPAVGSIAVEALEESLGVALQGGFEFPRALPCQRQVPLRGQSRMQHADIQRVIFVQQ